MSGQERIQKPKPIERKAEEVEHLEPTKPETDILDLSDELLDEIDGLLEENAEEFVKDYIQKGGQ